MIMAVLNLGGYSFGIHTLLLVVAGLFSMILAARAAYVPTETGEDTQVVLVCVLFVMMFGALSGEAAAPDAASAEKWGRFLFFCATCVPGLVVRLASELPEADRRGRVGFVVLATSGSFFAILLVGVQRRDTATAVNAAVSIAAVVLPLALASLLVAPSVHSVDIDPVLPLWVAAAGFLHSLGMVGLYERLWWWDHLTHTLSAAFVAAVVYAALVVVPPSSVFNFPAVTTRLLPVLVTFWVGVVWELLELLARDIEELVGFEPILVHYGWQDTAHDLVFDIVGATLVVLVDLRIFVSIASQSPEGAETFLLGTVGVTTIGSLVMALGVTLNRVR
jgi:hypothetical protein